MDLPLSDHRQHFQTEASGILMILIFRLGTNLKQTRQTLIHPYLGEKINKETSKARSTETNKHNDANKQINERITKMNGMNLKAMDIQIQLWKQKKEKQQQRNLPRKK